MPKKIKIPSIFKNKESKQPRQWWLTCHHPKTLSFRASNDNNFFASTESLSSLEECGSFSSEEEEDESFISGVRLSERLFFEANETSSLTSKQVKRNEFVFKDSVALVMESDDPYMDFKKSMQEMVESDEGLLRDWDCLEELLRWYLRLNGKMNHGFIVGAYVDLLIGLAPRRTKTVYCSDVTSYSYASSSFSSPMY